MGLKIFEGISSFSLNQVLPNFNRITTSSSFIEINTSVLGCLGYICLKGLIALKKVNSDDLKPITNEFTFRSKRNQPAVSTNLRKFIRWDVPQTFEIFKS